MRVCVLVGVFVGRAETHPHPLLDGLHFVHLMPVYWGMDRQTYCSGTASRIACRNSGGKRGSYSVYIVGRQQQGGGGGGGMYTCGWWASQGDLLKVPSIYQVTHSWVSHRFSRHQELDSSVRNTVLQTYSSIATSFQHQSTINPQQHIRL